MRDWEEGGGYASRWFWKWGIADTFWFDVTMDMDVCGESVGIVYITFLS